MAWGPGNLGNSGMSLDKAVIIITAPTGSAVSISYNGKTKTAPEKNGTWTFAGLECGEGVIWKASSTKGVDTAAIDIPTPIPDFYREEIRYGDLIYSAGNTYNSITGGWVKDASIAQTSDGTIQLTGSGINIETEYVKGRHFAGIVAKTSKVLDLSQYKYVQVIYDATLVNKSGLSDKEVLPPLVTVGTASKNWDYWDNPAYAYMPLGKNQVYRLNIEKVPRGRVCIGGSEGLGNAALTMLIKEVRLS